jgi:uncharacterized protein
MAVIVVVIAAADAAVSSPQRVATLMSMKERFDPCALELLAFCRSGATLHGAWPQAGMARLAGSLAATADADVAWSASGQWRPVTGGETEIWLRLTASTTVLLECQRCLQPMSLALQVDRAFRFVQGEAEAARLDEELEDDVLELPPRLDLQALVEDELILALPLVPRHERCPAPLPTPADAEVAAPAPPHPFAALAALRRRGPGGPESGPDDGPAGE